MSIKTKNYEIFDLGNVKLLSGEVLESFHQSPPSPSSFQTGCMSRATLQIALQKSNIEYKEIEKIH